MANAKKKMAPKGKMPAKGGFVPFGKKAKGKKKAAPKKPMY